MGTSTEVIAAHKCSRLASLISASQDSPGMTDSDPQAGQWLPKSGRPAAGPARAPAQAQSRALHEPQEVPVAGRSERRRQEGQPRPTHPCPCSCFPFPSRAASACLPSSWGPSFSVSHNPAGKEEVDSSKPLPGLDEQLSSEA